ncbi:MAG TPA: alpha/beta hydrolase [Arenimonas sp.]|uniref:alpha/beta hydrolase n=1 Tax=Arenimonas sp. TaxID=1872635 RepID=UPI002D804EAD|nr:alpha/beta hydrolase [Arenimonas sp.]HEU0152195.1 alpha/beta hydrolase [Arenimonas sp.]
MAERAQAERAQAERAMAELAARQQREFEARRASEGPTAAPARPAASRPPSARPPSARRPAPLPARPAVDPDSNYATMRVFYATDREAARNFTDTPVAERYGPARGKVEYGTAEVSIPREHQAGLLESPSILRLEFREDPARHVVLMAVQRRSRELFFRELSERVQRSEGGNAFLFVHGYNVAFADAARRTAQMSYDLAFDGAAVFYSWPSQASLPGYTVDESNIEWSTPHIKDFLVDFAEKSDAQNLYLIAHSMGNRGLTRALQSLVQERPDLRGRFREIILAAPDIDAEVFRRDLAPALRQAGQRVTLYASSNDLALQASKQVHGYARAGDSGDGLMVLPGVETIDATGVDQSALAHSYFVESRPVIRDILDLLRHNLPADRRAGLVVGQHPGGSFWRFREVATPEP